MADEAKDAPVPEDKKEQTGSETPAKKESTVGNLFNKTEKKEARLVPEGVLIDTKRALKEAQATIEEMKTSGASNKEIDSSLKEIAEKYDVDENFVNDIASVVGRNNKKELDDAISSRLKPIEEKEAKEKSSKMFKEAFGQAVENLGPEYKSIANEATIQALAREAASDPDRKDLTIEQILRETYGHLVKGTKKPIESVRPKAGGGNVEIDFNRAKTDGEYFKEIMSDPVTKSAYNKDLAKRNAL